VTQNTNQIAKIESRVAFALERAGRDGETVRIVAVSKGQPATAIDEAHAAGLKSFGENYLQEALDKMRELEGRDIEWHFIGRIQSNKTRPIAESFDWVHTVDRIRVARRLDAQRPDGAQPLNVLIQVNLEGEQQKGGAPPAELSGLARAIEVLPRLKLRGLMTLPPADSTDEHLRDHFLRVAALAGELAIDGIEVDTLSMGMSSDFETAILCGSNCVRIGTAIFGPRRHRQE
jgi:pyridoxal phosphate enzyme (YggS family)